MESDSSFGAIGFGRYLQFDGTNFNNWKFRIGVLLDDKGLRKPLQDILAGTSAENRDAEKRNERKCKSVLVQCIHDSQLEFFKDKDGAKEIYDALTVVFERKSVAGQLLLRKRLLTMRYNDHDDMNGHFMKFDKNVRDLKAIGATMDEMDIICHLLLILTLPSVFDNLVRALETLDPRNLTLGFVKSRLLDEYSKRKSASVGRNGKSGGDSTAMQAKGIECYNCGKIGHTKRNCRAKRSTHSGKAGFKEKDSGGCNANSAVAKSDETLLYAQHNENAVCSGAATIESFFGMHAGSTERKDCNEVKFVLDSGASEHMVNQRWLFESLRHIL